MSEIRLKNLEFKEYQKNEEKNSKLLGYLSRGLFGLLSLGFCVNLVASLRKNEYENLFEKNLEAEQ